MRTFKFTLENDCYHIYLSNLNLSKFNFFKEVIKFSEPLCI